MNGVPKESKSEWLKRISRMYELETETLKELAEESLDETSNHLDVLREIIPGNLKEAERAAHTIKGVAASLGQQNLADAAKNVEELLRANKLDGIEEKVKFLESTFDEFKVLVNNA